MAKSAFSVALAFALSALPGVAQGWPEGKASDRFDMGKGELELSFGSCITYLRLSRLLHLH